MSHDHHTHTCHRSSRTRGQALAETSLVVVMLVFLVMGIAELGWAFMRTSMIVHAARDGARFGATLATSTRNAQGCFAGGTATIQNHVQTALNDVGFTGATITVTQGCINTVPTVVVRIQGDLQTLFGWIGSSFAVDRSVTFEDENRGNGVCAGAC
jgi:Flp pilus assembly protein TadG